MSSPVYEPRAFLDTISGMTRNTVSSSADKPHLIAIIDPAYTTGNPKVTFEGETTMSGKQYAYINSYYPIPGDRVVLAPLGTNYVIIGSVAGAPSSADRRLNNGKLVLTNDTLAAVIIDGKTNSEAFERFRVQNDGRITWGGGASGRDTNLYRDAADSLKTDDKFTVAGEFSNTGAQTFTNYTPTVTGAGSATWTTRAGYYWKLGKIVFIIIHLEVNAAGTGGSNFQVNLPSAPNKFSNTIRQTMAVSVEGLAPVSPHGAGSIGAGAAVIFAGGSSVTIDRLRVPLQDTVSYDTGIVGTDLLSGALITMQGWYLEA